MSSVMKKFFIASMFMWAAPVAILYGFNHNILPVNIVIACYICMAMKEPSDKHEPDPAFLASAKASLSQKPNEAEDSSQTRQKDE